MGSQPVCSDTENPTGTMSDQEPVIEIIHSKPIMEQRTLTSTETEARRKHADVTMSKWIGLKKELKVFTIQDKVEVLCSMMNELTCLSRRPIA